MHKALLAVTVALLWTFGCGDGGGSSDGGYNIGRGGSVGSYGGSIGSYGGSIGSYGGSIGSIGSYGGAAGSAGGCSIACLNQAMSLMSDCQPSGTCTSQGSTSGSSIVANGCYSNGVKVSVSMSMPSGGDTSALSMSMTCKKDASVRYTMVVGTDDTGANTLDIKNASGALVASLKSDSSGNETVTCPGQAPVPVDPSCSSASQELNGSSSTSTNECATGSCSF